MNIVAFDCSVRAILDALVDKLSDSYLLYLDLPSDLHQQVNDLETSLVDMRSLLIDVEERQIEDFNLLSRLRLLKEILYDAVDVLDEFIVRGLLEKSSKKTQIEAVGKVRVILERIQDVAADVKAAAGPEPFDFGTKCKFSPQICYFETKTVSIAPILVLLQISLNKVSASALQPYCLRFDLRDDLGMLQSSLFTALAVISKVESLELQGEDLSRLLRMLKDSAYEVVDLLDELVYEQLKLKVEGDGGGLLKVARSFGSQFLDWDDGASVKVREVKERLDYVAADLKYYIDLQQQQKQLETPDLHRQTGPLPTEPQVYGRDNEHASLITALLESGDDFFSVISILGLGGVGKTTLAQLAYNYSRVRAHFQVTIWVSVSQTLDVKTLTKHILASVAGGRQPDLTNLNLLQILLREKLASKRFLLVLDDLWIEDENKWETLCAPLMSGLHGSKILVTTRSQKVVDTLGTTVSITLEGLPDDTFWQFFKKCAFGDQNSEDYPELESIGKKIAAKLMGLPLAAKTLGKILNTKLEVKHWRNIMESEVWELKQGKDDILPVLELSYRQLPTHLKQCFSFCSLFPKGFKFNKDSLVQMWIAQGFVTSEGKVRIEDVGRRYFDDLLHRSFFQKHHDWCTMHDLVRELALYVSIDECFRIEDGKSLLRIPNTIRHLSVQAPSLKSTQFINLCKNKKLRTLIFFGESRYDLCHVLDGLKNEVTGIHVLVLGHQLIDVLPPSICNLKHLRYLDMSHAHVRSLPRSFCSLYNLQSLKLNRTFPICFPKGMARMINLRHINADKHGVLDIAEIGKLTSLQELSHFEVLNKHGHTIRELKELTELHGGLRIRNLQKIHSKDEVSQAKLNNKKYLTRLCLEWTPSNARLETDIQDVDVLEGLQPHSNLKALEIKSYGGCKYPTWLQARLLPYLEEVHLVGCENLEQLPSLGQLPFLKVARIQFLLSVRQIGLEFFGTPEVMVFPSLEELVFMGMPEWEEWSTGDSHHAFPRLHKLVIKYCPKLREMPFLPPSLTELRLCEVGLNALPESQVGHDSHIINKRLSHGCMSASLSVLHIKMCQNLTSLEEWLLPSNLPCIKELSIIECRELSSLLVGTFSNLSSLEYLELRACPKLISAMQQEGLYLRLPSSLQRLVIDSSRYLDLSLTGCSKNLASLSTLKQLHILNCCELKSLPENGLPASLGILNLSNCHPVLKERCQKDGAEWAKIAHIPCICID